MNLAVLCGNIASDLELKQTQNDKTFLNFSIACNSGFGDNKRTDYFNCTAWGKNAENIQRFFNKGKRILLECTPQQNKYTDKNGNNVSTINFLVNHFEFIESKAAGQNNGDLPPMPSGNGDFMQIPENIGDSLPFK